MRHKMLTMLAVLLFGATGAQAAPDPAPDVELGRQHAELERQHAELERRLEDAHRRLEDAAREVAELSSGLTADAESLHLSVGHGMRPMLGVQLDAAPADGGARIVSVSPGSAAAAAGLQPGDVITSVNGKAVRDATDVARAIQHLAPGTSASIARQRGGKVDKVEVAPRVLDPRLMVLLGDGPEALDLGALADLHRHGAGGWGELELAALSPDLGRYFGADHGVLVVHAPRMLSERLKDGDVILSIGGREPDSVAHALRILRSYQPGEKVTLAIERDRKPQTVELSLPGPEAMPVAPHVPQAPPVPRAPAAPASPPQPGAAMP
jgi:S1-C subfamily serine protease